MLVTYWCLIIKTLSENFSPDTSDPFYQLWNLQCCGLALVPHSEKSLSVCLPCQLVQVGAFAYEFSYDVKVLASDSFTHCTLFNEWAYYLALTPFTSSAKCSQPTVLFIRKSDCNRIFLFHFLAVLLVLISWPSGAASPSFQVSKLSVKCNTPT